ncbi:MAG: response regulator [Desulfarculales bacterium]|jgi:signal transduction histidine kinase/response regulator of citrate/malate metabolism|nr:response regulator [Desulfarculales bacterium]
MKKLSFRLMALLLILCITGMGAITIGYAIFTGYRLVEDGLSQTEQTAVLEAEKISGRLKIAAARVSVLAADISVLAQDENFSPVRLLAAHLAENPQYTDMYIGYPDGRADFASGWIPDYEGGWAAYKQEWYSGAERSPERPFVTTPCIDSRTGRLTMTVARAIVTPQGLRGVAAADMLPDVLEEAVSRARVMEGSYTFLADREGNILAHTDQAYRPRPDGSFANLRQIAGGVCSGLLTVPSGIAALSRSFDGIMRYYIAAPVGETGWRLYTALPASLIREPVYRQVTVTAAVFSLVLLLTALLIYIMEKRLKNTAREAASESQMKSVFLVNMSHEIRTPLNGIIGFTGFALDSGETSVKTREYLGKIKICALGLLDVINNILDISKIESGRAELESIPFSLREILNHCETINNVQAVEKGLQLRFDAAALKRKLVGDPVKLRQALLNLLSNAIKFTDTGFVSLRVIAQEGEEDDQTGLALTFEVKDTGIGMNREQVGKIFTPFVQADGSITRRYGGTGLGLAITRDLVALMGGELKVESMPGVGSKFSFTLEFPLSEQADRTYEGGEAVIQKPLFQGDVLVCEDNRLNQEVIFEHLRQVGLGVTMAENGAAGLAAVRERMKSGSPFSLILMDIYMPVLDGLSAVRELTAMGVETPVVAMTANVMSDQVALYARQGIAAHIGKPFTARELWTCLLKFLVPVGAAAGEEASGWNVEQQINPYIVNRETGLKMAAGNQQLYQRLLGDFLKNNRGFYRELGEALDAGNATGARRMVHTLKNVSGLIGAGRLRLAASALEKSLAEGRADCGREQMRALETALNEVLEELSPLGKKEEGGNGEGEEGGELVLEKALALAVRLEPMLRMADAASLDLLEEIKEVFAPLGESGKKLIRQIDDYEFEAAWQTLGEIQKKLESGNG